MTNSFETLKTLLIKNGYGQIVNTLTREQVCDFIKEEVLDDLIDLSKSFEKNEEIIQNSFYKKNWVSLYSVFSKDDVEQLYTCVKELINK